MNIAFVINSQLPALLYGGTERVLWGLLHELHTLGHKLYLIAPQGTTCPYAKVIIYSDAIPLEEQIPQEVDLTHFHVSVPKGFSRPHIVTVHGNTIDGDITHNAVFVSKNHAQRFGVDSYVLNGLNWEDYPTSSLSKIRRGFHFLGKAAWKVKNLQGAIDTVLSIPRAELNVLGGTRLNFKMGFRLTLSPRVHFFGMVDDGKKAEVISTSQGLVFPVRWHEPFGLAIIESLYYGAPIFATRHGSLPELVPEEVGYLSNSSRELAQAMTELSFSPSYCHEYARVHFSASRMAQDYLKLYEQVLNGYSLCPHKPSPIDVSRGLEWQK